MQGILFLHRSRLAKEPIAPGKSATDYCKYDTNRVGPIHKTVRITSNATNGPVTTLTIKGNVIVATVLT
jgi:hypothetical protein